MGHQKDKVAETERVGAKPDANPEVKDPVAGQDLQRGESVSYAPEAEPEREPTRGEKLFPERPGCSWYVLRAAFNKVDKAIAMLEDETTYLPKRKEMVLIKGKRRKVEKPLINNLFFIYTTKAHLNELLNRGELQFVSCQYDHTRTTPLGLNPVMVIDRRSMINFVNATIAESPDMIVIDRSKPFHYKSNDIVEITYGDFKGVRGRVARIASQQRVVVELAGFMSIATSYIPTAFLRKV